MKQRRQPAGFMAVLALMFVLVLVPGFTGIAKAASEDVAMFYDDLSQHGQWAEYENYGPVWRPSQVPEDWRPYTDGRWVPTNDGYVFESQEPWAWATYHYGNWMPTEGNGWVWVPGRTWYPSTVEWRTSPENTPPEDSYVGWAPIPPPNYVPPPSYAPASYAQGNPVVDALTAPFWIFAKAASFLLGLGQPYAPAYSYETAGILVPPAYVPVFYPETVIVSNYVTPAYYPPGFLGARRFGFAAYNWGPPPAYLYRVGRYDRAVFNRAINNNSVYINRIHNVVPPRAVVLRHGHLRQIIPPALTQGRPLPRSMPVHDIRMAQANLYKPNILPPPRSMPRINTQFPRLQPVAVTPGHGIPGTALPGRATMPLTPNMERQIQGLPPQRRFTPAPTPPFRPTAATQPGQHQPGFQPRPGQVQPGVPGQPGQVQPGGPPQPGRFQPGPQTRPGRGQAVVPGQPGHVQPGTTPPPGYKPPVTGPGYVKPGTQPSSQPKPGEIHPGASPAGAPPRGTSTPPSTPGAAKPGTIPQPPGSGGLTPEQRRQQELERQRLQRGATPGQPPQPQPQRDQERLRQQQMQQQQQRQQQRQRQIQMQQQQRNQQIQQQRQQQQRQQQQRPQPQVRPQPKPQPQPRVQPQPQPRPQPQRQEKKEQQKKPHEQQ